MLECLSSVPDLQNRSTSGELEHQRFTKYVLCLLRFGMTCALVPSSVPAARDEDTPALGGCRSTIAGLRRAQEGRYSS